ncbi:hypothetical protein ZYGR_0AI02610 [Zygosaccharomyces rouxii]|uniref:Peptidase M16 N-terminal domain-containing protein n=1 Tax=Zygosaccharomyces rouxii TaxID=4956 RepID=A0A1Q3AB50_ZYGRO|nr:hypothetical protein ZYGR_0AI02610 [Zygosaccharomyces rouxii]
MTSKQLKYYDVPFLTPFSFEGRTHRLCKLPNGLLTLLISDPTENSSACSLSVATGSHNDPPELPGLAHLCEHMVLAAGSKKYPNPGYYHEMIMKNGGSQNAFTTGEQTTFYFEFPNIYHSSQEGFAEALDVFASFFSEPLFNSALINKEIYAIESEHDVNLSNQRKIFYQATRLLANGNHPFSRFSTGNISTLNSIPHLKNLNLKNLLHEYFKENFCASKMTLCLRGPQSIHSLAKLALSKFSQIKSNPQRYRSSPPMSPSKPKRHSNEKVEVNPQTINILKKTWLPKYHGQICFTSDEQEKFIFIKSSKHPAVRFIFPIVEKYTRFTPKEIKIMSHLWSELLGDESPGSFGHWLQKKGWVTYSYAFVSEVAIGNSNMIIELDLTKTGFKNLSHIANVLFEQVIPAFSQKNTLELAQFMSKQNCIDLIRFLYQNAEISPMEECANLSCLLQDDLEALDPACIFKGSPLMIDFKHSDLGNYGENKGSDLWWIGQAIKFQSFLKQFMVPSNMWVIVSGNTRESQFEEFSSQEFQFDLFYEFEYFKHNGIPFRDIIGWTNDYQFMIPQLGYPMPHIASSYFQLKKILNDSTQRSQSAPLNFTIHNSLLNTVPHLVSQNRYHEMWVMPDNEDPSLHLKSIVSFEIFGLDLEACPRNTMNLEILGQTIFILISPEIYSSLKLGFTCEITSNKGDIRLGFTISGFSEQLISFVKSIIETIKRIPEEADFLSKETLRRARILVRNNYENAANENCANIGSIGLYIILEKYMWTLEERLEALEDIDTENFKHFCQSFLDSKKYLSLFVQGDLSCADDINGYLHRSFTHHLDGGIYETKGKTFAVETTKILEPGTNACVQHEGQKDDPNNSIIYFIQTGRRNDRTIFTLTNFTAFIMSLNLTLELRNKRQVGYLVISGLRLLSNSVGLHITIMSGGSPIDLENKIDEYLWHLESQLQKLDEQAFHREYIRYYLQLLDGGRRGDTNENSGPADLLNKLVASVQIGDSELLSSPIMKRHKKLQTQIIQEQYDFITESEAVDGSLISQLSLKQYLSFFKQYISIYSKVRSKISIMVSSSMTEKEIVNKKIFLQLETFLKIKGFAIPADELKKIVERSNGKPKSLAMELYSSFRTRSDALRLCSAVLAELFKMLAMSLRHRYGNLAHDDTSKRDLQEWNTNVKPALDLKVIEDINFFKRVQI